MEFLEELENLYDNLLPDLEQGEEIPADEPTPWEKIMLSQGDTKEQRFDRAFLAYVAKVDQIGNQITQLRATEEYYAAKTKEAKEARQKLEEEQKSVESFLSDQLRDLPKGKYQASNGHVYGTRKSSSVQINDIDLVPLSAKTIDVNVKINMFDYYKYLSSMADSVGVEIGGEDVAKGLSRFIDYLYGLANLDDLKDANFMTINSRLSPSKSALKKYQAMQKDNPTPSELGFEIVENYALTIKK